METQATGGVVDEFEADTSSEEYQLLKAYCTKRRRQQSVIWHEGLPVVQGQGPVSDGPVAPMMMNRVVAEGIRVSTHRVVIVQPESGNTAQHTVVNRLAQIANSVLTSDNIEADGLEDQEDVIRELVELLKNSGDQLNEEIKRNKPLQKHLQSSFNYAFFEKVTSTLQGVVGGVPTGPAPGSEDRVQKEQIAMAFEVTSLLSAVDLLPMRRAMGYGERYVRLHHSSWVKQHGGWGKAFEYEDID